MTLTVQQILHRLNYDPETGLFRYASVRNQKTHIGTFCNIEDASEAYALYQETIFGEFVR